MSDLTAFLLARYDEDEAWYGWWTKATGDNTLPRFLADVQAKRAIVARVTPYEWDDDQRIQGAADEAEDACRILAAVYSDHPDYDERWRP